MVRRTLALAAVLACVSTGALAQSKQDFVLVNKTGYTIDQVYVSPSRSSDWEEDVLGQDQLGNGEFVTIRFNRATKTCKWDVKVVYDDNESAEWDEFDLCTTSKITIKYNKSSGETSAEYE
ncbi:hypothetical protein [Pararhodospirillum photometricum]|uniref:Argininosuccinate lyase n=1 Tax=Pararhodospirillum photometricum DSM 122 TaxID=1150469 RepID=H6SQP8_PARPM|nr:hypothetical protein [Pararhodospirillum photometricum]CCG07363.1 Putative uncharacterized protein [Pararhodospirillum photometricum DSM 122]